MYETVSILSFISMHTMPIHGVFVDHEIHNVNSSFPWSSILRIPVVMRSNV
jgi:hypothetical protein